MSARNRRLFLAGDLPDTWLAELRQAGQLLQAADPDARITKPGNEHLTWVFLGELEEAQVQAVLEAVDAVFRESTAQGRRPQALSFDFARWTAQQRRGGLALVRADLQVNSAHADAVKTLTEVITQTGVTLPRRSWLPHVTLARDVRWSERRLQASRDLPRLGSGHLESVTLYESLFTARGMVYEGLLSWPGAPQEGR